jgi:hypothetical protein
VRRIIRGYRNRDRLKHQMMAECVYAAMFAMRDPKGKTVKNLFPQLFEDDDDDEEINYTNEEVAQMQAEMESAKELFKMAGTE